MSGEIHFYNYLSPVSWLYALGVDLRNRLFDRKIIPSEEFSVPVISVGNLAVGGTGKTPHVEYLVRLLQGNRKVAVLSRGYKRKSSGFILAGKDATSDSIGDEPYQIFRKFSAVQVAVDSDRCHGIRYLLGQPEAIRPEVILLDDSFQHRYVKPSLSILLTDYNRLYTRDKVMPVGRLREPAKGAERADIVVVTKCPGTLTSAEREQIAGELCLAERQQLFFSGYRYGGLQPLFPGAPCRSLQQIGEEGSPVLLLAGIASPAGFVGYVRQFVSDPDRLLFPDHHAYTSSDMKKISEKFHGEIHPDKVIITTEKDAVRLMGNSELPEDLRRFIYYIPLEVEIKADESELFNQRIKDHVRAFK